MAACAVAGEEHGGELALLRHGAAAMEEAVEGIAGEGCAVFIEPVEPTLSGGAEAALKAMEGIDETVADGDGGIRLLAVGAVEGQEALKYALLLSHGDGGEGVAVTAQGAGHNEAGGRAEREGGLPCPVIDGDSALIAAYLVADHDAAVGGDRGLQHRAVHGLCPAKTCGGQHIQLIAADVVGYGAVLPRHQRGGEEVDGGGVKDGAVFIQHLQTTLREDGEAAAHGGEAAGFVAVVGIELGDAHLVLFGAGVDDAAAQSIEGVGIPQHRRGNACQNQQDNEGEPQPFAAWFLLPRHAAGCILLHVALGQVIEFLGGVFHNLSSLRGDLSPPYPFKRSSSYHTRVR